MVNDERYTSSLEVEMKDESRLRGGKVHPVLRVHVPMYGIDKKKNWKSM